LAQAVPEPAPGRPMATRAELQQLAAGLQVNAHSDAALLARVRTRLALGDFRPGDRVRVSVQQDSTLTDTFVVTSDTMLRLRSPAVGAMALRGVLRSELDDSVRHFVARFVVNPVVHAEPLLGIAIEGGVLRAGFYHVAADARLGDAVMAAGGATADARMDKLRVVRDGKTVLQGHALDVAIANGMTVDGAGVEDGDRIVVPQRGAGDLLSGINLLWALVSIAGGIYALSRAF